MAVNPSASVRTDVLNAMRSAVANGTLEILSESNQVLAIFGLDATAGSVTGDTWTIGVDADTVQGETAAGDGTSAAQARFKDSGGNVDIDGLTVSLSSGSGDIKLVNVSISNGQNVTLSTKTISYPGA